MIYRVRRPLIDGAMVICTSCKLRAATHSVDKQNNLCCECYIAKGGVPAIWHPDCVRAYARKISNKVGDVSGRRRSAVNVSPQGPSPARARFTNDLVPVFRVVHTCRE